MPKRLSRYGALSSLPASSRDLLTGREFFPFAVSAALGVIAAIVSLMRGTNSKGALSMPLTTIDPRPALAVIDLQKGIVAGPIAQVVPPAAGPRTGPTSSTSWTASRAIS